MVCIVHVHGDGAPSRTCSLAKWKGSFAPILGATSGCMRTCRTSTRTWSPLASGWFAGPPVGLKLSLLFFSFLKLGLLFFFLLLFSFLPEVPMKYFFPLFYWNDFVPVNTFSFKW